MRIAMVGDAYPPTRNSGAVQYRDLAHEIARQGHTPTVMVPSSDIMVAWRLEEAGGVQVLRLRAPKTRDVSYVRRTFGEMAMPFIMLRNLRRSPLSDVEWDGVVWWSPSIFFGPLMRALKRNSHCRAYMILRDIFPEWAVDLGLLKRGLVYRVFKAIESYQYSIADVIGVQTPASLPYLASWARRPGRRVEVLQNWLSPTPIRPSSIRLAATPLSGRSIFVYAGNMGLAQGVDVLLDLAEQLLDRQDIGFLFVGRGSDAERLRADATARGLSNVLFHDEIEPDEIPGLYAQCAVGVVALDRRHQTHNTPGKFLSYMRAGLPVLASINTGNDLAGVIEQEHVGKVSTDQSIESLQAIARELIEEIVIDPDCAGRCQRLWNKLYSTETAARQVMAGLVA